jgi:hypothetical protein
MTTEQINTAIGEACGWTQKSSHFGGSEGIWTDQSGVDHTKLPDYCNNLNAMHEAEMCIPEDKQALYDTHLVAIVGKETGLIPSLQFRCIHASAKQRAKAFLRTVGKWDNRKWWEIGKWEEAQ